MKTPFHPDTEPDDTSPGLVYTPEYARLDRLVNTESRARNVISQFVHQAAPMTPEQRAAWTAWKDGEG